MPAYIEELFLAGTEPELHAIIITDILTAFLMLTCRLSILLPASIMRILTEASLLLKTQETIIPSPDANKKGRGARIAEVFPGHDIPVDISGAWRLVHVSTCLWLTEELHVKKCLIEFFVEMGAWLVVLGFIMI